MFQSESLLHDCIAFAAFVTGHNLQVLLFFEGVYVPPTVQF